MRVQTKLSIVLIMCFLIFAGAVTFFFITEGKIIETIFEIDSKKTEEEFDRISNLIGDSLATFVFDYTYWDEMVTFARTGNKEWAKINIDTSLSTYKANAVWLYGLDENVFYAAKDIDDSFYDVLPVPKAGIGRLFDRSAFCHFFVNTPKGVMEIRGATIHPSEDKERTTPRQGYFFAGRLWDENFLKRLSEASGNQISTGAALAASPSEINVKKGALTFFRTFTGWDGASVSTIIVRAKSKFIPAFNAFSRTILSMLVGFSIAVFFFIAASIILWVIGPLGLILRALSKEDPSCLARLARKRDELGSIAHLIENFFQQRRQLIGEVATRARAEKELLKEREFSESIINTAQGILLLLDDKGRIITFNPYLEQISGYRLEEVKGKSWFELFLPKEIRDETRELFSHSFSGIQTKGHVNAIIAKDGHELQIEWYDKVIKSADGGPGQLLAIGVDVTERMQMEREARKHLKKLEVFYKASIGREERILELKKEIDSLKKSLK